MIVLIRGLVVKIYLFCRSLWYLIFSPLKNGWQHVSLAQRQQIGVAAAIVLLTSFITKLKEGCSFLARVKIIFQLKFYTVIWRAFCFVKLKSQRVFRCHLQNMLSYNAITTSWCSKRSQGIFMINLTLKLGTPNEWWLWASVCATEMSRAQHNEETSIIIILYHSVSC